MFMCKAQEIQLGCELFFCSGQQESFRFLLWFFEVLGGYVRFNNDSESESESESAERYSAEDIHDYLLFLTLPDQLKTIVGDKERKSILNKTLIKRLRQYVFDHRSEIKSILEDQVQLQEIRQQCALYQSIADKISLSRQQKIKEDKSCCGLVGDASVIDAYNEWLETLQCASYQSNEDKLFLLMQKEIKEDKSFCGSGSDAYNQWIKTLQSGHNEIFWFITAFSKLSFYRVWKACFPDKKFAQQAALRLDSLKEKTLHLQASIFPAIFSWMSQTLTVRVDDSDSFAALQELLKEVDIQMIAPSKHEEVHNETLHRKGYSI